MKRIFGCSALLTIAVLVMGLSGSARAAGKMTLLIHPTLFKAMGGAKGVVADLKKEKGIDVTVVTAPYGKIKDKGVLSFASGGGQYDVVTWVGPWINSETIGFLEPLDKNLKSAPAGYAYGDIIPSLSNGVRFPKPGGPVYGIPYRTGMGIVYYRKDLFAKKGVSIPKTWGEFLAAAEKLNEPGKVYGVVQRGKPGVHVEQDFKRYLHSTGVGVISNDGKKCTLDDPKAVKVLKVFGTPFHKGWSPPDMLAWGRDEYRKAMMQGRAAMGVYFSPYWGLMNNPKKSKVAGKLGWFLMPTLDGKNVGRSLNGGWYVVMDKMSKNKKAAFELMLAMTNKKNQLRGALNWSNGPVRASVYENAKFQKKLPVAKAWLTALSRGFGAAQHPRSAEISDFTSKEVINFLQKKKSAKQAMTDACKQINSLLR
ncbi:MAG: extracellular solute-binding protein [Nitrospinota bacterium]